MKNLALTFICTFGSVLVLLGQQRINGAIDFQTDPAKKFSLYIPSNYDANVPNEAFLALHPFNTRRWNARSWRDTLIHFAETNDLILICPDGGLDGRIDDPIDTAFTTFLLDSVERAYNIDQRALFVIGFSWGARTTYTYGLRRSHRFAGYIPLGAAINGLNEIGPVLPDAVDEPIFIIHGSEDAPQNRFFPARLALNDAGACVRDTLLNGVGHTVDFPGRNALLDEAYGWLKSINCGTTNVQDKKKDDWRTKSILHLNETVTVPYGVEILGGYNLKGVGVTLGQRSLRFASPGVYIISYTAQGSPPRNKRIVVFN